MAFDPNQPATNSPLSSAVMRAQFNGLKDLIDAQSPVTAAQVDGVNTTDPTNPALAAVSLVGDTLHFTFTLPRGNDGQQGMPGTPGSNGGPGPQGPPFAQAIIDAVNTLNPGDGATVSVMFDGSNVRFTFGIPRGADGAPGAPGEVTTAQMTGAIDTAVAGTSSNSNAVATLDTPFADPDAEALRQRFNDLVLALRRP